MRTVAPSIGPRPVPSINRAFVSTNIESHLQLLDHDREARLTHIRLLVYNAMLKHFKIARMGRGEGDEEGAHCPRVVRRPRHKLGNSMNLR